MANTSSAELQGTRFNGFVDHSNCYTYRAKDEEEVGDWVLNLVVKITAIVRGDDQGPDREGDALASVTFANQGTCSSDATSKKRVTRIGRQTDGKTIVFGPKLAFVEIEGVVKSVELEKTNYAWIPSLLSELEVPLETSEPGALFAEAAATFHGDALYSFALTLGGFYMGLHYEKIVRAFHRCPTVLCVGDTNCCKSWAVARSANFIASNAAGFFEHKSLTPAAARDASFKQDFPVLWHDPSVVNDVRTVIEENYERKSVATSRDRILPRTSKIITCNPDFLVQ